MTNTEPVDPVSAAQTHMARLKELTASLKDEKAAALKRASDIDDLLAELGDIAKPKVGRPRKSTRKGGEQPATTG